MEVFILDENFEVLLLIDTFESFIWTERYNECGDFELYTNADEDLIDQIQQGYYVQYRDSEDLMIIESMQVETDYENGNHLTLSGRSVTSILDRRIVWKQTIIGTGGEGNRTLQEGLKKLLNENLIEPEAVDPNDLDLARRKVENVIFEDSEDPNITELLIRAQYTGDNLLEVIETICKAYEIGFRIYLNSENQLAFKLYAGSDRSYGQNENPLVIFSPKYDNISQTSYLESDKTLKNVTLVLGEGEGSAREREVVGDAEGLDRRELYTDARDIQSEDGEETIPTEEYHELLRQRGLEKLAENQASRAFDGEIEATGVFIYGRDFFQGDILQVENEFGLQAKVRVTEYIRSQDDSGIKAVPTFTIIDSGMTANERKYYTKVLYLLSAYGIVDDDFNNDIEKLTIKDISKLENHAILDEQYGGILDKYDIPSMLAELEGHILLDDDFPEPEEEE